MLFLHYLDIDHAGRQFLFSAGVLQYGTTLYLRAAGAPHLSTTAEHGFTSLSLRRHFGRDGDEIL